MTGHVDGVGTVVSVAPQGGSLRIVIAAPRERATAVELAKKQRDISVSEFFAKNRHLLGFDSPRKALLTAVKATEPMARMAAYERQAVLMHCVKRFQERFDELAYAMCIEAGKPIKDARGEVTRLIDTFRIAAEEAVRNYGEVQPLDISARAKGYMGMWKRVPIGPCSFISPFNFPLNLAAHKIAPALAVGNGVVAKPSEEAPSTASIMASTPSG